MRKSIIIVIFSLFVFNLSAQTPFSLKRQIKKAFRLSKPNDYNSLSDIWMICNQDSAYYLNDTISLINNRNGYSDYLCYEYVQWQFLTNTKFKLYVFYNCIEPPKIQGNVFDVYEVKFKTNDGKLHLIIYKKNSIIHIFEILKLEKAKLRSNNVAYKLTLKRINTFLN